MNISAQTTGWLTEHREELEDDLIHSEKMFQEYGEPGRKARAERVGEELRLTANELEARADSQTQLAGCGVHSFYVD